MDGQAKKSKKPKRVKISNEEAEISEHHRRSRTDGSASDSGSDWASGEHSEGDDPFARTMQAMMSVASMRWQPGVTETAEEEKEVPKGRDGVDAGDPIRELVFADRARAVAGSKSTKPRRSTKESGPIMSARTKRNSRMHDPGLRGVSARIRDHVVFQVCSMMVIALNSVLLVVQTDSAPGAAMWAEHVSLACVLFFVLELLVRIGARTRCRLDSWLLLDTVACIASILEVIMDWVGEKAVGDILVIIGVLRLFRLLRLARAIYHFRTMRLLIQSVYKPRGEGWTNTLSVTLFLMTNFLIMAVLFTSLFNPESGLAGADLRRHRLNSPRVQPNGTEGMSSDFTEGPYSVEDISMHFGSVGRSMLALFQTTAGGGQWLQTVVQPLLNHDSFRLHGMLLLISMLVAIFGLGNMVFGVWIRQLIIIGASYDKHREHADVLDAKSKLLVLFRCLKEEHQSSQGRVTMKEIVNCYEKRPQVRQVLRDLKMTCQDLCTLHSTLDVDCKGLVGIIDLMVSMLKHSGTPMSVEMLVFYLQQYLLLCEIADLDRDSEDQWQKAIDHITGVHNKIKKNDGLQNQLRALKQKVEEAQEMLHKEIEAVEVEREKMRRKRLDNDVMKRVLRERKREDEQRMLKNRLDDLRKRLGQLQRSKQVRAICNGSDHLQKDLCAAVRSGLMSDVEPWLSQQLA